ncbi:MAG: hypothetical protein LBQ67_05915 [Treponema sp.]|jgi:DNA-binding transcriptional regulator LsrR (DeoR family)|nr:hypothetical protein [Treponema sp.]
MKDSNDSELLTRLAWMYYCGGMNQQEIAEELSLPRIKVVRLLKSALDMGIVHITIEKSRFSLLSIELELKKISGLQYCVVVPSVPDLVDALSRGMAHLCNDIIGITGNLGFGFSRSLGHLDLYLKKGKCSINSVVSICGTTSPNLALRSFNSGFHIAQALNVDFYTILAPVIVDPGLKGAELKRNRYVSMVLEMAKNVDYALVGIGNVDDSQLTDLKYITDEDYKQIVSSNAVGEIIAHYFTIDGKIKPTKIDDRLISVDFPMKCPVIAAAGGLKKVGAIAGAIRSGFIQGLVTDEKTALALIEKLRIEPLPNEKPAAKRKILK